MSYKNYITKSIYNPRAYERNKESKTPTKILAPPAPLLPRNFSGSNPQDYSGFSFQNLLKAYYQCRRHKRKTTNAAKFELNFENELLKLELELRGHTYKPGHSICFVVAEPKPREVFAADFRDRIIHHLLVNHLELIWEKKFIHHSYSCRKDKGAHRAIKNLKKFLKQAS